MTESNEKLRGQKKGGAGMSKIQKFFASGLFNTLLADTVQDRPTQPRPVQTTIPSRQKNKPNYIPQQNVTHRQTNYDRKHIQHIQNQNTYNTYKNIPKQEERNNTSEYNGIVLGSGSYGCAVTPPIPSVTTSSIMSMGNRSLQKKKLVGKLMSHKDAQKELEKNEFMRGINTNSHYTISNVGWSRINTRTIPWFIKEKCGKIRNTLRDDRHRDVTQILYENAGIELTKFYSVETDLYFEDLLPAFGHLIKGILLFTDKQFMHMDIWPRNILYERILSRNGKEYVVAKFIDYGLARYRTELCDSMLSYNGGYLPPVFYLVKWLANGADRVMSLKQFLSNNIATTKIDDGKYTFDSYEWHVYDVVYKAMDILTKQKKLSGNVQRENIIAHETLMQMLSHYLMTLMNKIIQNQTNPSEKKSVCQLVAEQTWFTVDLNCIGLTIASMFLEGMTNRRIKNEHWCDIHVLPIVFDLISAWCYVKDIKELQIVERWTAMLSALEVQESKQ